MTPLPNNPIIWAEEPKQWPPPPEWMSFYRLREAESCPMRAALRSATYPDVWSRRGYPPRLRLGMMLGQVLHSAIRTLGAELARHGCSSILDPRAVDLLKHLGGFTQILRQSADRTFADQSHNPRSLSSRMALIDAVQNRLPELREQLQAVLTRLQFDRTSTNRNEQATHSLGSSNYEVELRASTLGWIGVADYIGLSDRSCEIVDFKSGSPDEDHKLQILVYALLWARDQRVNPSGRRATKLTVSYETEEVDVPAPSENELQQLESEIKKRTDEVNHAFNLSPPDARPSLDNCRFCDVRHLCNSYWVPKTQQQLAEQDRTSADFSDVEAKIISQQSAKCWKGFVISSRLLPSDTPIVLRTPISDNTLDGVLLSRTSGQVRILDARIMKGASKDSITTITVSGLSEWFAVRYPPPR